MENKKHEVNDEDNGYSSGELKIVIEEEAVEKKPKPKKRKRYDNPSDSSDEEIRCLPKNCLAVEEKVCKTAAKTHLTAANVKNILKRVVTNEHVLAVVKLREEEMEGEEEPPSPQIPTPITRSKAKEMTKRNPDLSWPLPITPVKSPPLQVTSLEVSKLIEQDLAEEESGDEEYEPNFDEASEDERDTISSISDIDSQPRTPVTPGSLPPDEPIESPSVKWSDDGLFKIPNNKSPTIVEPEPTIALRTRSKLCLNDTPIEAIEQSFIPPDEDVDDYHIDNVWTEFLSEFTNPKSPTEPATEDDDEADPEYNAAGDHERVEEEELRDDEEDVEVTRKELNDLVAELFDLDDMMNFGFHDGVTGPNANLVPTILQNGEQNSQNSSPIKLLDISKSNPMHTDMTLQDQSRIEEIAQNISLSAENMEQQCKKNQFNESNVKIETCIMDNKLSNGSIEEKAEEIQEDFSQTWMFREGDGVLTPFQREILNQQMRQHVQLTTQNYLQIYGHPEFWQYAPKQKEYLMTLKFLAGDKADSAFAPCNLEPGIDLCNHWQAMLSEDTDEMREMMKFILNEHEKAKRRHDQSSTYYMKFPVQLTELIFNSAVFVYPNLLPMNPFRTEIIAKTPVLASEDHLMALGLEGFTKYILANPGLYPKGLNHSNRRKLMDLVSTYLVPARQGKKIIRRLNELKRKDIPTTNALMYYHKYKKSPETLHTIIPFDPNKKVKDHDVEALPGIWKNLQTEYKNKHEPPPTDCLVLTKDQYDLLKRFRSVRNNESQNLNTSDEDAASFKSDAPNSQSQSNVNVVYHLEPITDNSSKRTSIDNGITHTETNSQPLLIKIVDNEGCSTLLTLNTDSLPIHLSNTATSRPLNRHLNSSGVTSHNTSRASNKNSEKKTVPRTRPRKKKKRLVKLKTPYNLGESCQNESCSSDGSYRNSPVPSETNASIVVSDSYILKRNQVYEFGSASNKLFNTTRTSNTVNPECPCINSLHINKLEESLPKNQKLLTDFFGTAHKRHIHNSITPYSRTKNTVARENNISHISSVATSNNQSSDTDRFQQVKLKELDVKCSAFSPYNDETHNLSTVLCKLKHLLFINRRHLTHGNSDRPTSKLKSTTAQKVQARLLQEIELIENMMLPSMPYLSTPSKSNFDDSEDSSEMVEVSAKADAGKNTNSENAELPPTQTSKKTEEKTPSQGRNTNRSGLANHTTKHRVAARAQRELEANKAMFATSDPYADNLKDTLYATAFFEKVQSRLTAYIDSSSTSENSRFVEFQNILDSFDPAKETPCDLYYKLEKLFGPQNEDLTEEFLTFLTAGQAVQIGRFMDHFLLNNMSDFIERLQIYFARRPAQLRKVLWCLEQIVDNVNNSSDSVSMESIKSTILPHLKGNQYLVNWFLRLFPSEKPQESFINSGYEVLDIERMTKEANADGSSVNGADYEVINVPPMEDSYGNDSCKCECHNSTDEKYRTRARHCISCGMKYIQGRLYIQHGKGLRAARVVWGGGRGGGPEQIRRLSAPSTRTAPSCPPLATHSAGRRRAASLDPQVHPSRAHDSDDERTSPKRIIRCLRTPTSKTKYSKTMLLSKSATKSSESEEPIKPSCSKSIIRDERNTDSMCNSKNDQPEKLAEVLPQCEIDDEQSEITIEISKCEPVLRDGPTLSEETLSQDDRNEEIISDNATSPEAMEIVIPSVQDPEQSHDETIHSTAIKTEAIDLPHEEMECIDIPVTEAASPSLMDDITIKTEEEEPSWTREEDKAILVVLQCESDSEYTFEKIRRLLPHRSIGEIRDRFQSVMQLLQQMASDS